MNLHYSCYYLLFISNEMRTKILPTVSVNKGCCSHQAVTLQPPGGEPCGNSEWRQADCPRQSPSSSQCCSHPPDTCTLRGFRMREHRILALDSQCEYQRNDFSEPRLLYLPIHKKALNSLTSDILFLLLTVIF